MTEDIDLKIEAEHDKLITEIGDMLEPSEMRDKMTSIRTEIDDVFVKHEMPQLGCIVIMASLLKTMHMIFKGKVEMEAITSATHDLAMAMLTGEPVVVHNATGVH